MRNSVFPLGLVVPLTSQAVSLFEGQAVRCADPDLHDHPAAPIMTQGKVVGFDADKGDVLVSLKGERGAGRRFKPYQLTPEPTS